MNLIDIYICQPARRRYLEYIYLNYFLSHMAGSAGRLRSVGSTDGPSSHCEYTSLKGTNTHPNDPWFKKLKTELMVEIYSKSLVRAIGKVFLMKLS